MKIEALQKLYIDVNGKPRGSVPGVVQMIAELNKTLSEMHAIQEPPSLRDSVTRYAFEKLSKIEDIQAKSGVSNYLGATLLQRNAELQSLKTTLKDTYTKDDDMVNDLIGG